MEKFFSWKKDFFSSTFQFYSNGTPIGYLKIGVWSNNAKGIFNDKEYDFNTKGFINQETIIVDTQSSIVIATITYNRWKSKATIKLADGLECTWQYCNFWHTKWTLSKNQNPINYHGSNLKGEIAAYIPDEVLILAGLFISNHYWQSSAAVAAT